MKRKILGLIVGFLFVGINGLAADGDLTVDGNVGIGTTNPGWLLHLNSTSPTFALTDSDVSTVLPMLKISTTDGGTWATRGAIFSSQVAGVATDVMSIINGNVGIGTASPGAKLEVYRSTIGSIVNYNAETGNPSWNAYQVNGVDKGYVQWNINDTATALGTAMIINNIQGKLHLWDSAGTGITISGGNIGIGTTEPGGYKLYVAGTAYSTGGWQSSDFRFKENIKPIESPLNKILGVEGVSFDWKTDEFKEKGFPEGRHYGVIAQRVEKVLPEVVKEGPGGEKSVSYTELIPVLIEAIKEQQKEIGELRAEINELRSSIPKNVASLQR